MKSIFKLAILSTKKIHSSIEDRIDMMEFRVSSLKNLQTPIIKNAFDTRRFNANNDINPRRNLQSYHRSDPFITKDTSEKIKTLFKLKATVDTLKDDFSTEPEWLDSYCKILSAAVDRTLRVDQKDMDFSKPQIDYLDELLYLRYRLKENDIISLNEKELRNIILAKDERLLYKQIYANYNNDNLVKQQEPALINNASNPMVSNGLEIRHQDHLINKLFTDVKASKENPNVKRSVNITIEDSIVQEKK